MDRNQAGSPEQIQGMEPAIRVRLSNIDDALDDLQRHVSILESRLVDVLHPSMMEEGSEKDECSPRASASPLVETMDRYHYRVCDTIRRLHKLIDHLEI